MSKYTIVADIHGNLPALEAVLGDSDVDDVICLGDIVGILGWPEDSASLVRERAKRVIYGNHDARIHPDHSFVPSGQWAHREHKIVTTDCTEETVEWVANLPSRIENDVYVLAHAWPFQDRKPFCSPHGFQERNAGVMPGEFTTIGPYAEGRIVATGHTHRQHAVDVSKFPGQDGLVINPGAVGVPYDGVAEYAIVDTETHEFELKSIEFDTKRVVDRLESEWNLVVPEARRDLP